MTHLRQLVAGVAMAVLLAAPAGAQSAANFDVEAFGAEATAQPAPDDKSGQPSASRYAGADLQQYTTARAATLAMAGRTTDPFGYFQDPQAKVPEKKPVLAAAAPAAEPPVALAEIVRLIEISAVMPKERQFLVGTRMISLHDRLPVTYRNKNYELEVVEVSSRQVTFRNGTTGETASSRLHMLPAGMSRGGGGAPAPGMTASGKNAPLRLGPSPSPGTRPPP
jgi:hypothetical protein